MWKDIDREEEGGHINGCYSAALTRITALLSSRKVIPISIKIQSIISSYEFPHGKSNEKKNGVSIKS